jgi:hypothetical protein
MAVTTPGFQKLVKPPNKPRAEAVGAPESLRERIRGLAAARGFAAATSRTLEVGGARLDLGTGELSPLSATRAAPRAGSSTNAFRRIAGSLTARRRPTAPVVRTVDASLPGRRRGWARHIGPGLDGCSRSSSDSVSRWRAVEVELGIQRRSSRQPSARVCYVLRRRSLVAHATSPMQVRIMRAAPPVRVVSRGACRNRQIDAVRRRVPPARGLYVDKAMSMVDLKAYRLLQPPCSGTDAHSVRPHYFRSPSPASTST